MGLSHAIHRYFLQLGSRAGGARPWSAALSAAALLLCSGASGAGEVRTQFGVSATVLPVARVQSASMPPDLQVSSADLRRGYIDVRQPASIVINSNSAEGVALDLMALDPLLSGMVVEGLDSAQVLGAEGGTLVRRWSGPQSLRLTLRFRFMLAPGLSPGRYPWPVHLGVRPL